MHLETSAQQFRLLPQFTLWKRDYRDAWIGYHRVLSVLSVPAYLIKYAAAGDVSSTAELYESSNPRDTRILQSSRS